MSHFSFRSVSVFLLLVFSTFAEARTITVTTSDDEFDTPSGGRVSLREAVRDLAGQGGTICLSASVLEIVLDRELRLTLADGLTIIDGEGFGGVPVRIVPGSRFDDLGLIVIDEGRVQIKNAVISRPASIRREYLAFGVDVGGRADVRLEDCRMEDWTAAERSATAVRCRFGSSLAVVGCEFKSNKCGIRGVAAPAGLTVENSLFYFNRDGAIISSLDASTDVLLRNSTFAENFGINAVVSLDGSSAGGIVVNHCSFVDNVGVAFRGVSATAMDYCLFARNVPEGATASASIAEFTTYGVTSRGYNVADDAPAGLDEESDMTGVAVKVSRLGDFGGERYCCFPLAGSRAIDGGDPNRASIFPLEDVRGFARKAGFSGAGTFTNIVDIGAVEVNPEGTLVVSQTGSFGAGSLRDAVANSSGETAHIVVQLPIGTRVLAVTTPIVFDEARTFNIDATRSLYEFRGGSDDGPLFEVNGADTAVSFAGLTIEDYELAGSLARGFLRLSGGKLALHESHFDRNQTEEQGIVSASGGQVFLNECSFSDNVMTGNSTVGEFGGVALDLDGTATTVWNSSFIGNRTEARNGGVDYEGGAVRMMNPRASVFRQCTFARNQVRGPGSAIYFGDYSSTVGTGLSLDRCTIVGNENATTIVYAKGAVAFQNRSSVAVGACLFSGNRNAHGENVSADLYGRTGAGSVSLSRPCPNWTDLPEAFPGLVEAGNLSAELRFAPPAGWGGEVPTMPLLNGSGLVAGCDDPEVRYPRDAMNEIGFGGALDLPTPGAVQRMLPFSEALSITEVSTTSDTVTVRVRGKFGVNWIVETSTDLVNFVPTGQTYTGAFLATTIRIDIPQPRPAGWYYRFREVAE